MKLLVRARKLMTANFHDWLDRRQSPETMARQGLRELHEATQTALAATAQSIVAERLLERQHADELAQLAQWDARAAAAVQSGDEELARQSLAQKFHLSLSAEQTARRLAELSGVNQKLRSEIERLRVRYARARDKLAVDGARLAAASAVSRLVAPGQGMFPTADIDLEHELERVERSALEAEVKIELRSEPTAAWAAEFHRREEESFIRAELERLRSAMIQN
jgi:phage shock protein A